jgi:hypothetical protein
LPITVRLPCGSALPLSVTEPSTVLFPCSVDPDRTATEVALGEPSLMFVAAPETSQLPPLRVPLCSWTGLSASRSIPVLTSTVRIFENAGLALELLPFEARLPGAGRPIDPADNAVPVSVMKPWLASEVAIETLPTRTGATPLAYLNGTDRYAAADGCQRLLGERHLRLPAR